MLDLIRRLIPEIGGPAHEDGRAEEEATGQKIAPGEVLQLGPEVEIGHDWFEVKGRRFPRLKERVRQALPEDASHFRPAEADDFSQSVPRRHEIFAHLTADMADLLERIAEIDSNPRLGSMMLISGPTGCGKTTLAKTYCFAANLPITELNFSGDSTLTDFFHRTEVITDAAGTQTTQVMLGPAAEAMLYGKKLLINELNMLPADLMSAITSAVDTGRLLLSSTRMGNVEIALHEDFGIIATANPDYIGTSEMGKPLRRRFGVGLGDITMGFLPPEQETESLLAEFGRIRLLEAAGIEADPGIAERLVAVADRLRNHQDFGARMRDRISTRALLHWLATGYLTGLPMAEIGARAVLTIAPGDIFDEVARTAAKMLGGLRAADGPPRRLAGALLSRKGPEPGQAVPVPELDHPLEEEPDAVSESVDGAAIELSDGVRVAVAPREAGAPRLAAFDRRGQPISDRSELATVRSQLRRQLNINLPQPLGNPPERDRILPCLTGTTHGALQLAQSAVLLGWPVLLRGPSGCGKSALARTLAAQWHLPVVEFSFTGETDKSDLTAVRQMRAGRTRWNVQAFMEAVQAGYFVIINEYNLAYPDVHSIINSLFDKAGLVTLPDGSQFRAHPHFRLVATAAPDGPGVKPLNEGVENRFGAVIAMDYPPPEEERAILAAIAAPDADPQVLDSLCQLANTSRRLLAGDLDEQAGEGFGNIPPDLASGVAERTALTTAELVMLARGSRDRAELVAWYRRGVIEGASEEIERVLEPVLANYGLA
ncbi:MAG: MoxR family ATPase [Chloroflexota bacterium]|nr:MoxR family ATPase [Chloroflexota bacterium]